MTNNDHWYTTDVLTAASSGNKGWNGIRESFGKTIVQSGAATSYLMRFPGQWEDSQGGFSQNLWREYKNITGRYATKDWWQFYQEFTYVNSSPITLKDPVGLEPCRDCCKNVEWDPKSGGRVGGTIRCCGGSPKVCLRPI
jgi:RHS repeat-associated protein